MTPMEGLKLALASQGIPPEIVTMAEKFGADIATFVATAIERNEAETIRARAQAAQILAGIAGCEEMAGSLIEGIRADFFGSSEDEEAEDEPAEGEGKPEVTPSA